MREPSVADYGLWYGVIQIDIEAPMKMFLLLLVTGLAAEPCGVQAQAGSKPGPMIGSVGREWRDVSSYIARAADQVSDADYAFQATPAVRTFAQLIGHLADSQFETCAAALGESPKAVEGDFEKKTSKAELVAAFRASTNYCARAYAQPDVAGRIPTKLFGGDATRFDALLRNAVHDGEHYGNIVTYMRLKGMVPPSSQPRPPAPPPAR